MSISGITNFRSRTQLKAAVARFVEDASTAGDLLIGDFLDLAFEELLSSPHLPPLVRWADSAVSVSSGGSYLHSPKHVRELIAIVDTTQPWVLRAQDLNVFTLTDAGFPQTGGQGTGFTPVGDFGINTTLTAGSSLEVLSSGSDTRTVTIRGILNGEYASVTTTLSGATPVAVSSTWDDVFQVYVSAVNSTRIVTVRLAGAGATVSTVGPNELDAVYHRYRLNRPVATATVYRLIYKASPMALVSDSDIYPLPVGPYLYHSAIAMYLEKRRQGTLAQQQFALGQQKLNEFLMELERQKGPTVIVPYAKTDRPLAVVVIP